jgi:hypothetical protein
MKGIIPKLLANAVLPNWRNVADASMVSACGVEQTGGGTLTPSASVAYLASRIRERAVLGMFPLGG